MESTRLLRSDWEFIEQVVIDGSDQAAALENAETCKSQLRVNYIEQPPKGISDAFNQGVKSATYKWVWFLNGGDQLNPELSLPFFHSFLMQVTADILIFQIKLMQKGSEIPFPSIDKCFPPVVPWIPHPATIIRKEIFSKHGLFDEKYKIAMDYELWIRVYSSKVVMNMVSIPLTLFDETGISHVQPAMVNYEGMMVLKKYRMQLFKRWLNSGRSILKQFTRFKRSAHGN